MIQLKAATRLQAMRIVPGDNYEEGQFEADSELEGLARAWTVKKKKAGWALLITNDGKTKRYAICTTVKDFKRLDPNLSLGESGIESVDAFITITKTGEVASVWVTESARGKGVGKALYQLAHDDSYKGIHSSLKLGTMSVGLWLSMYKANSEIQIAVGSRVIPRDDVTINGLNIGVRGEPHPLTDPQGPDFTFRWPK